MARLGRAFPFRPRFGRPPALSIKGGAGTCTATSAGTATATLADAVSGIAAATSAGTATATVAIAASGSATATSGGTATPTVTSLFSVSDKLYDGMGNPIVGYVVLLQPTQTPLFVKDASGILRQAAAPWISATTDATGAFTLIGVSTRNQSPSLIPWQMGPMPDGKVWTGLPTSTAAAVTIPQLIASGWVSG